jgi:hypothetical protein
MDAGNSKPLLYVFASSSRDRGNARYLSNCSTSRPLQSPGRRGSSIGLHPQKPWNRYVKTQYNNPGNYVELAKKRKPR